MTHSLKILVSALAVALLSASAVSAQPDASADAPTYFKQVGELHGG